MPKTNPTPIGLPFKRPILDTTLKLPKHSLTLEINQPSTLEESRLTAPLPFLELKRTFPDWDVDTMLDRYCSWDRPPEPIDIAHCYVLFGSGGQRGVSVVELPTMYMVREPIMGGARLIFPIKPKDVAFYPSRLSNTVKELFPIFYAAQELEHAKAVIAKLDKRKPKPSLKKSKPPLKRLSNERWWRNQ